MHLHHTVYGNNSPFIEVSLLSGAIVLVSEGIDDFLYPGNSMITIPSGEYEARTIFEVLKSVIDESESFPNGSGSAFVKANNSLDSVISEFQVLFPLFLERTKEKKNNWTQIALDAKQSLMSEIPSRDSFSSVYNELGWNE